MKAFVGIASNEGLAVLHPERDETISFVERSVWAGPDRVGFWAVIDDAEARCVQALFVGGLRREAMLVLDRTAREIGRILPSPASLVTLNTRSGVPRPGRAGENRPGIDLRLGHAGGSDVTGHERKARPTRVKSRRNGALHPRDREAAHRAEMEGIATDGPAAVTCRKCLDLLYKLTKGIHPA